MSTEEDIKPIKLEVFEHNHTVFICNPPLVFDVELINNGSGNALHINDRIVNFASGASRQELTIETIKNIWENWKKFVEVTDTRDFSDEDMELRNTLNSIIEVKDVKKKEGKETTRKSDEENETHLGGFLTSRKSKAI